MTYTAKTVKELRGMSGSLLKKVVDELSLIDTQIDTIDALAEAKILVGNAAGAATDVDMSGDVTIVADGTTAIGLDKVASTMVEPTYIKVISGALTAGVSGEFSFAWQNPEDAKVLVHRVIVDITTAGGESGAQLDVGVAANATTAGNDIFDDIDMDAESEKISKEMEELS